MRGVPLRIEIGPKDLENKAAVFVRRDTGTKETIEGIQTVPYIAKTEVNNYLDNIHDSMFKKVTFRSVTNVIECNRGVIRSKIN